jgi:hypothetical protein
MTCNAVAGPAGAMLVGFYSYDLILYQYTIW